MEYFVSPYKVTPDQHKQDLNNDYAVVLILHMLTIEKVAIPVTEEPPVNLYLCVLATLIYVSLHSYYVELILIIIT